MENDQNNAQPIDAADGVQVERPEEVEVDAPVTVGGEDNPVTAGEVDDDVSGADGVTDDMVLEDVDDAGVSGDEAVDGTEGDGAAGVEDGKTQEQLDAEREARIERQNQREAERAEARAARESERQAARDERDRAKAARKLGRELRGPRSQKPSAGEPDPNNYREASGEDLGFVRNVVAGGAIPGGGTFTRDYVNGIDNEDPDDEE